MGQVFPAPPEVPIQSWASGRHEIQKIQFLISHVNALVVEAVAARVEAPRVLLLHLFEADGAVIILERRRDKKRKKTNVIPETCCVCIAYMIICPLNQGFTKVFFAYFFIYIARQVGIEKKKK
jgi:hypothetical protein